MYLIASLGNPSPKYDGTRHNVGRVAVEYWAIIQNIITDEKTEPNQIKIPSFGGSAFLGKISNEEIIVVPNLNTFMNESGAAVASILRFKKISPENLILVHDDVDLTLGALRVSHNSSAAGHKGVESVIKNIGTQEFTRLRLGVESRSDKTMPPTDDFVLQHFTGQEETQVNEMARETAEALNIILTEGAERAMAEFN